MKKICKEYHDRIAKLEDSKYDLEYEVRQKDYLINELQVQVSDMRGKLYVFPYHINDVEINFNLNWPA